MFVSGMSAAGWSYYSFFSYRSCINGLMAGVPADEKELPPGIADVFIRSGIAEEYSNNFDPIIFQCRDPRESSITAYRAHQMTWSSLVHWYLTNAERLSLYIHFLSYKDGYGLSYGAKHFFSKKIDDLTEDETIKLILIARHPAFYSNGKDINALNQGVIDFRRQLEKDESSF